MEEVRTLNNSRSRLSHHTLSFPCPLVLYQIESSVYEQTLLSPHRAWVFLLKWFRSCTCGSWSTSVIFSSSNACFWRKEAGPHMAKGCMDFASVWNTRKCFSLTKLVFWSRRDFVIPWKGEKNTRAPLKDCPSHLAFLNTVTLLMVISPLLFRLFLGALTFPSLCVYITWLTPADTFC